MYLGGKKTKIAHPQSKRFFSSFVRIAEGIIFHRTSAIFTLSLQGRSNHKILQTYRIILKLPFVQLVILIANNQEEKRFALLKSQAYFALV